MQDDSTLYVGLDVHKDSIMVAYAVGMSDVELLGKIGTTQIEVDRLCKRLQSKARHIYVVYEAGPCGYGLYRRLIDRASTVWCARHPSSYASPASGLRQTCATPSSWSARCSR